jgi:Tfp pilus assembly protein PilX
VNSRLSPTRPRVARPPASRVRARGFSLIIAMLLLAVIGLVSAAIMRNAVSGEQAATGNRLQTQASQYAQLALRFCESQLAQPAAARVVALRPVGSPAAWTSLRSWTSSDANGGAHTLAAGEIGSTVQPAIAPQCLMEATAVADVYTVTARGFSADFRADPGTGATRTGSAVWLQATIYATGASGPSSSSAAAVDAAAAGPLTVRQRLWQQLLTPPF